MGSAVRLQIFPLLDLNLNMKIVITAVGTRGDLQPFIALGLELKKSGHEVIIVSAKNEENFVRNYGLDFFALGVDIQKLMDGDEVQKMSKGNSPLKFILSHLKGSKKLKELMIRTQGEIWNACQNADVIIFHPGMPLGFFIAKEQNKISILANPFPVLSTKEYPSILFYTLPRMGKYYNLLTHFIFDSVFWALSKSAIVTFWKNNVGSKMNFSTSAIKQQIASGMPVINGYSELFFHHPKDWSKNITTTGSWIIESDSNFKPQVELEKFIKTGESPIYIGFGSMKDLDAFEITFEIILKALELTGQRAVVGLGWSSLKYIRSIPNSVFLIENVPHTWLFPQMKIVIHHGGAGTTVAGLIAGKPTIIIPHNADQPAWGQRVFELGLGPKPIKKTKLTAKNLADAIKEALKPEIVFNTAQFGRKLRKENGVEKAVTVIIMSQLKNKV